MLPWVEQVLRPYVATAPDGVVPILFLDSYRCHMMALVVTKIQDLGVEVKSIPEGCTGLCQRVEVGVIKPFKNSIREQWEAWMIEEGLARRTTSPPLQEDIVRWTRHASSTSALGVHAIIMLLMPCFLCKLGAPSSVKQIKGCLPIKRRSTLFIVCSYLFNISLPLRRADFCS